MADPLSHAVQLERARAAIGELLEMIDGLEAELKELRPTHPEKLPHCRSCGSVMPIDWRWECYSCWDPNPYGDVQEFNYE